MFIFCLADDPPSEGREAAFNGLFRPSFFASYYGCELYWSEEFNRYYNIYIFERSEECILDFRFRNFGQTQEILRQILQAIIYAHSLSCVITNLSSPSSFVFYQMGNTISVKLLPCLCVPEKGKLGRHHTKKSNLEDMARLFCKFFFGLEVDLEDVTKYDHALNHPPIRFVPTFGGKRAYALEVVHFIKRAAAIPSAILLKNHPVMWLSSQRLHFFQDAWECCKSLPKDHFILKAINSVLDFDTTAGIYWLNFDVLVRMDLGAPEQSGGCAAEVPHQVNGAPPAALQRVGHKNQRPKHGFKRGSSADFRRRIHGEPPADLHRVGQKNRRPKQGFSVRSRSVVRRPRQVNGGQKNQRLKQGFNVKRGSAADFLRCLRNFVVHNLGSVGLHAVHGRLAYREFDTNVCKGSDLLFSANLPTYFMGVFATLFEAREAGRIGIISKSLENYLNPSYDALFEAPEAGRIGIIGKSLELLG